MRTAERMAPESGGKICWCRRADSNRQPIAYEAIALPLSYCGVQKEPCIKLLSNKPPPVEEARSALSVVPAHSASKTRVNALLPGTHNHRLWNMGPRLRGDDGTKAARRIQLTCDQH